MSSFTSDEDGGDDHLDIKPPQAHQLSRERRRDRDRYSSSRSSKSKDYRRSTDEDRSRQRRREYEQPSAPVARNGGVQRMDRNPRISQQQHDRDRGYGRGGDHRDVSAGSSSSSSSRLHRKHGDKYQSESSKSGSGERRDDRHKELLEQKERSRKVQEEGDRLLKEIERKREKERREEMKRYSEKAEKRKYTKSRSPTPQEVSEHEYEEEFTRQEEKSSEKSKSDSKSSFTLYPEVEDIEESSSGLEDGEQISPQQSHSDVSESDNEEKQVDKRPSKTYHAEDNLHSDVSDRRSSSRSRSRSVSPPHSKGSSRSSGSDSEREGSTGTKRNGASDNGEKPAKIFKSDSPISPDSERETRKAGSDVEVLEGNGHTKTTHGNSDSAEVEEATDVLNLLPPYYPAIQGCRRVEEFKLINRIEEGTYGVVYRAEDKRTNEIVALKRLKMEKEKDGFPITSLREINTLLKAQHENIVTVREIVVGSNTDKIFLVMDYVEHDLKALMETLKQKEQKFIMGEVKCLMIQLLRAVAHLHDNWILHRDLKTSNLLLSHQGILKVGDFGLAREYGSPLKQYTPIVVTLWYRAPELLLGMKDYSCPIDVWSVGCIFGELLKMEPMFPGKSEANQLNLIFQTLGTPNDKIWPGYSKLPLLQKMTFADYPVNKLKSRFPMLNDTGIDLMNKFLTFNPAKRITAEKALQHEFFTEAPLPIDPSVFPTWPAKSELGHRKASSPKPPSGGRQFKDLRDDDSEGFFLGIGDRRPAIGPGFNLKF